MQEFDLRTDQQKSQLLQAGLNKSFISGFPPEKITKLHLTDPRKHQDVIRVLIGQKPAATYTERVIATYRHEGVDYLGAISRSMANELHQIRVGQRCVWNAPMVDEVMEQNSELLRMALKRDPRHLQGGKNMNPYQDAFDETLSRITHNDTDVTTMMFASHILGYPERSAQVFVAFRDLVATYSELIHGMLAAKGLDFNLHYPLNPRELLRCDPQIRQRIVSTLYEIGFEDKGFGNLVEEIRLADVPGFRYITRGDLTVFEEAQARARYKATGIEECISSLAAA